MKLFATAALLALAAPLAPALAATPAPVAANLTQLDHISIVQLGTSGSPVILIPGLASPRAVWDGIAPSLARSHRVYLVQVNGFGGDDPRANAKGAVMDGVLADLDGFITRNKLQGAAVIGHSMGGTLALMLAHAHPADVGKLMVVDALPFLADVVMPGMTVAEVTPIAAQLRDRLAQGAAAPGYEAGVQRTATMYGLKPETQAQIATWSKAANTPVVAEALYEDMTTDLRPAMAEIATPITLLYPWAAPTLPKDRADTLYHGLYAKAPHVTFVPVGESRHFIMLDQPQVFASAVDAFLAS